MVTGVRIEGHQVVGAQIRMERSQTPLPGGNDSARARLGSVVSALRNDSGQLRSGYLRLAANQDGSFQMRAGHSLLGKSEQARARDYVLQTIKDAYGDVPGMDQAINRYLSSGQSGGKLGTVSTLKLIRSLEEMRLRTTGKSEGGSALLDQTTAITVGAGKTGRLATDFVASAQASWEQTQHLSQGWAKLAPQLRALHVDINQALSQPELNSDEAKSLAEKGVLLSLASNQLGPSNPKEADFAIKQAWLKTPEGRQMTDQLRAMHWKVLLISLTTTQSKWQASFEALKPGEDHSALRQEAAQHLSSTESMFSHIKSSVPQAELKQMEGRLGGSQKLNSQITQAMSSHIALMKAGIKHIDSLPKPESRGAPDSGDSVSRQHWMAFYAAMNAQENPSAGDMIKIQDRRASESAPPNQFVDKSPSASSELSEGDYEFSLAAQGLQNLNFFNAVNLYNRGNAEMHNSDYESSSARSSLS